jgi:putative ABC transport system permease protein
MNPLASCKVAIAALKVNALRSFLAMLGVIIGVASVIVMVSVATGAGQAIEDRIKALGTNVLVVMPGSFTSGGRRAGEGNGSVAIRSRPCRDPHQSCERLRRGGNRERLGPARGR